MAWSVPVPVLVHFACEQQLAKSPTGQGLVLSCLSSCVVLDVLHVLVSSGALSNVA